MHIHVFVVRATASFNAGVLFDAGLPNARPELTATRLTASAGGQP